jgi:hypothetical protein
VGAPRREGGRNETGDRRQLFICSQAKQGWTLARRGAAARSAVVLREKYLMIIRQRVI